jgi:hypothetical protein
MFTYLVRSPETAPVRTRALCVSGGLFVLPLLLALIPVTLPVTTYGVLRRADETTLFARSPGFIETIDVKPGEHVAAGARICRLVNDEVLMRLVDYESQLAESRIRMNRLAQHDGRRVADELSELNYLNKAKKDAGDDVRQLTIDAPAAGEVLDALDASDVGSFIAAGTPIARVGSGPWTVALLVRAEDMATIRPQEGQKADVCVMSSDAVWTTGLVKQIAAAGSKTIAVAELTHLAGGDIAVDDHNMKASAPYFEITLRLADGDDPHFRSGMTALARFQPSPEALWKRLYRTGERFLNRVRQL